MAKKKKPDRRIVYIHNHISTVDEFLEIALQHLKWVKRNVKFIKKISRPKNTRSAKLKPENKPVSDATQG